MVTPQSRTVRQRSIALGDKSRQLNSKLILIGPGTVCSRIRIDEGVPEIYLRLGIYFDLSVTTNGLVGVFIVSYDNVICYFLLFGPPMIVSDVPSIIIYEGKDERVHL